MLVVVALCAASLTGIATTQSAQAATSRYEAESATISQGILETSHTGFSGSGYVNGDNVAGSYLEFTVNAAAAGSATLAIRYSNGTTANRPANVAVNGTVVSANRAFNPTTNWDTWATSTLTATLNAGANTVRITATGSGGNPNIDYLDVTASDTPPPGVYEAESATLSQAAVASNHTGFSGTGFVDYVNTTGGYIEFSVTTDITDRVNLTVRYANGTTANRPLDIAVNGTVVSANHPFNATANWDTWTDATITTTLQPGANTVRLTATGSAGGPNVDKLTIARMPPPSDNPYGDPYMVAMFNRTNLDGWTPHKAAGWTVQNDAIHGTGTAGRGWIYYNKAQYGSFRWIFNVRQVTGDHAPTVLIWGTTQQPYLDALGAIQFQPPNGGHWDYRPGHNNGGGSLFTSYPHTKWDIHNWSQCEIVANQATGVAKMACCPLTANATVCTAVPVLGFKDATAGRVGPLAIQIHNGGIQDEYRSLYVESPVVMKPDDFITTG